MVATGPLKGRHYEFTKKTVWKVGRGHDCSLQLPGGDANLGVSRYHCEFEIDPPDLWIRDLGSLNGTYINGTRIGGRGMDVKTDDLLESASPDNFLRDGDVIRVGNTLFCVVLSESDWCPETPREHLPADKQHMAELAASN